MRIVDPLLPQLSASLDGLNPLEPIPSMHTVAGASHFRFTPSCPRQRRVDWQSSLVEKLVIRDVPLCAIAAMMAARCEMDLSPGTLKLPRSALMGETVTLELERAVFDAVLILISEGTSILS
jgi:hypothetical protein